MKIDILGQIHVSFNDIWGDNHVFLSISDIVNLINILPNKVIFIIRRELLCVEY